MSAQDLQQQLASMKAELQANEAKLLKDEEVKEGESTNLTDLLKAVKPQDLSGQKLQNLVKQIQKIFASDSRRQLQELQNELQHSLARTRELQTELESQRQVKHSPPVVAAEPHVTVEDPKVAEFPTVNLVSCTLALRLVFSFFHLRTLRTSCRLCLWESCVHSDQTGPKIAFPQMCRLSPAMRCEGKEGNRTWRDTG